MATGIKEIRKLTVKEMKTSKKIKKIIKAIIKLGLKHHPKFKEEFEELIEKNRALSTFQRNIEQEEIEYFTSFVADPARALEAQQKLINYLILYRNELLKIAHNLLEKRGYLIDLNKWMKLLITYTKEEEDLTSRDIALLEKAGLR